MIRAGWLLASLMLALSSTLAVPVFASPNDGHQGVLGERRLVFGSFSQVDNAHRYAAQISKMLALPIEVAADTSDAKAVRAKAPTERTRYRVVGPPAAPDVLASWSIKARDLGLQSWRLPSGSAALVAAKSAPNLATPAASAIAITITPEPETSSGQLQKRLDTSSQSSSSFSEINFDLDVGVQNRLFAYKGSNTDDRAQQSASALLSWSGEFGDGRNLVALAAFGRWDSDDDQRTHADVRELSVTHIADRWQLQAGLGQVFWGVVEFNHLIDVVNQTDLVENPDGEDKLGQPMVAFTALPNWGSVELYLLPGFRERTLLGLMVG